MIFQAHKVGLKEKGESKEEKGEIIAYLSFRTDVRNLVSAGEIREINSSVTT